MLVLPERIELSTSPLPSPYQGREVHRIKQVISRTCAIRESIGAGLVPREPKNSLAMPAQQQVRVALDERHARPATFDFERQQVALQRVVPAGPGVAQIVRRQLGIELGAAHRPAPSALDLAAIGAAVVGVGAARRQEHRTMAMRQVGQRRDDAGRQGGIASLAAFGSVGPEDRAGADQVDIAPVEVDGFAIRAPVPIRNTSRGCRCAAAAATRRSASSGSR